MLMKIPVFWVVMPQILFDSSGLLFLIRHVSEHVCIIHRPLTPTLVTFKDSGSTYMLWKYLHCMLWIPAGHCAHFQEHCNFLGMFIKLQKVTVSFIVSICLSTWNSSAPTARIFMKFDVWSLLENLPRKLVSLESDKNNLYFIEHPCTFMIISRCVILMVKYFRWRS
jgi:hypothetical protein